MGYDIYILEASERYGGRIKKLESNLIYIIFEILYLAV
jgi:monoamine oxidase